jgi:hypothetical protein
MFRTFNRPQNLTHTSIDSTLNRLELFWESEVARAGEPGAFGWASWEAAGCPDATTRPPRIMPRPARVQDPYARWAEEESVQDQNLQLPTCSLDEDVNDDPYSTVLFGDIRPLLMDLTYPGAKQAFRLIWLSFLGLHIPGFAATLSTDPNSLADSRWSCSHLANPAIIDTLFPYESATRLITADSYSGVLIGREHLRGEAFSPIKQWTFDIVDPLDGAIGGRYRTWSQVDADFVNPIIVREVFQQCRLSDIDISWDTLRLAFEAALDSKQ